MKVTVQSKEERGGVARRGREGAEEIKEERGRPGGRGGVQLCLCKLSHPAKIASKEAFHLA